MSGPDVLQSGPDVARRVPRRLLVVAGLLAVLVAAGDRWQLHRETTALVRCVENGQAQIGYSVGRVAAVLQYASPQLYGASTPARVRDSLAQVVRSTATEQLGPLAAERRRCERGQLVPWHSAQRRARNAYLAYLAAGGRQLLAIANQADEQGGTSGDVERRRRAARDALVAALPAARRDEVRRLLSP